jgi:hypothetical protein
MRRGRKMGGWVRVGIILSVIWFFVGGWWGNTIGIQQGDWATRKLSACYDAAIRPGAQGGDASRCNVEFYREYDEATKYHWYSALFVALVPIPLAWLVIWAIVGLWRWVRSGFSTQ